MRRKLRGARYIPPADEATPSPTWSQSGIPYNLQAGRHASDGEVTTSACMGSFALHLLFCSRQPEAMLACIGYSDSSRHRAPSCATLRARLQVCRGSLRICARQLLLHLHTLCRCLGSFRWQLMGEPRGARQEARGFSFPVFFRPCRKQETCQYTPPTTPALPTRHPCARSLLSSLVSAPRSPAFLLHGP